MLRRLALLLALFSPVAGLADVAITPTAFGLADCTSSEVVTLAWTSSGTLATGDKYRVWVSTNSNCPSSTTPTGGVQLPGGDIAATSLTGSYPVSGTLKRSDFILDAGITSCTTNQTIYVCVQHLDSALAGKAVITGSAKLEVEPPPVPINVSVGTGDSALFVAWAAGTKKPDGTTSAVSASSYNVTAVAAGNTIDIHSQNTNLTSHRLDGLTNSVTYDVTVTSVSAGGQESTASSPAVQGTPQPVDGFWQQYKGAGGVEQGGCGGGPAGALALLGVALALRAFRRRS